MSAPDYASLRAWHLQRRYRRTAVVGTLVLVVGTLFVFTKQNPFASRFTVRAVFSSVAQLHPGGEVRIAGVRVGKVDKIAAGPGDTAIATMQIDRDQLPVHADATFTIKPRLVLEGNAYIDLKPGTPGVEDLRSGALVPEGQTAVSVQLDEVLNTLTTPVLAGLHSSIGNLASGLSARRLPGAPSAAGSASLREAMRELTATLPSVATVAKAAQGTDPGDLARTVKSTADMTTQLAADPAALAGIIAHYNTTMSALASEQQPLARSISGIDAVLRSAPPTLRAVDAALPTLTDFAQDLRPALRAAPSALDSTNAFLDQIGLIVRPSELPALLSQVRPLVADLPGLQRRLHTLFSYTAPFTSCIVSHVIPTLNTKLTDGPNSTGDPVYLDLVHAFTGLTGFASAVDGNGGTVRLGTELSDHAVSTVFPGLGQYVGNVPNVTTVRPRWLGYNVLPPYRPDQPCARQPLPDLNTTAAVAAPPAWMKRAYTAAPLKGSSPVKAAPTRKPAPLKLPKIVTPPAFAPAKTPLAPRPPKAIKRSQLPKVTTDLPSVIKKILGDLKGGHQ